jgi:hypothetical protein
METHAAPAEVERARLAVILTTIGISVSGVVLFSTVARSDWRTAILLSTIENLVLIGFSLIRRDLLIPRLMLFGLAVGATELLADAWLVDVTGTLDYSPGGGPMIWRSPFWMPLAWETVAVQFGYLGMRLFEWRGGLGLLLTGVLGAINIPFYEEMALRVHWWRYAHCRMLLHTPYYIILGEFLIAICIGYLARATRSVRWSRSLLAGILAGLGIFACYYVAYRAIEGWR